MATLIIKIGTTGEEVEVSNVDLDDQTPMELITELINNNILPPEETLPLRECTGTRGYYGVVSPNGLKISPELYNQSFKSLNFLDGDIVRIYVVACCA